MLKRFLLMRGVPNNLTGFCSVEMSLCQNFSCNCIPPILTLTNQVKLFSILKNVSKGYFCEGGGRDSFGELSNKKGGQVIYNYIGL